MESCYERLAENGVKGCARGFVLSGSPWEAVFRLVYDAGMIRTAYLWVHVCNFSAMSSCSVHAMDLLVTQHCSELQSVSWHAEYEKAWLLLRLFNDTLSSVKFAIWKNSWKTNEVGCGKMWSWPTTKYYEGWNFNFGNAPLDWIQELLEWRANAAGRMGHSPTYIRNGSCPSRNEHKQ